MQLKADTIHLVRTIAAVARTYRAPRVIAVKLWLGARVGISAEALRACFIREAAGTPVEGAALEIESSADKASRNAKEILIVSVELAQSRSAA